MRFPDWPSRLDRFMHDRADNRFRWGVNDCALFSCDGIHAMTGVDVATEFRGLYKTKRTSMLAIKRVTGEASLFAAASYAAAMHAMRPVNPSMAGRGDWVLLPNGNDVTLGLVHLNGKFAVAVGDKGLVRMELATAVAAWRV